jgi:hypothetical protein
VFHPHLLSPSGLVLLLANGQTSTGYKQGRLHGGRRPFSTVREMCLDLLQKSAV